MSKSYDIKKAFKFIAEIVRNNMIQKTRPTDFTRRKPPIPSCHSQLPRMVHSTPEPRVLIPPIHLKKMAKNDLDMRPQKLVKNDPIIDHTPILPPMPAFQELFPQTLDQKINHMSDPKGNKISMDSLLLDPLTASVWWPALENELGRLSQGFKNRVTAQDAMDFIKYSDVPKDSIITYANFIYDYHPLKTEQFRV